MTSKLDQLSAIVINYLSLNSDIPLTAKDKTYFQKLSYDELWDIFSIFFLTIDINLSKKEINQCAKRLKAIIQDLPTDSQIIILRSFLKAAIEKKNEWESLARKIVLKAADNNSLMQNLCTEICNEPLTVIAAHALGIGGVIKSKKMRIDLEGAEVKDSVIAIRPNVPDEYKSVFDIYIEDFSSNEFNNGYLKSADAYQRGETILMHIGWSEHSATAVIKGNVMMICNKGAGTLVPSIKIYTLEPKSQKDSLEDILNPEFLRRISNTYRDVKLSVKGLPELNEKLAINKVGTIRIKGQKIGNCTYTNSKRAVQALMMFDKIDLNQFNLEHNKQKYLENIFKETTTHYHRFTVTDRKQKVDQLFTFNEILNIASLKANNVLYQLLARYYSVRSKKQSPHNKEIGQYILEKIKNSCDTQDEWIQFLSQFHKEIKKQDKVNINLIVREFREIEQFLFSDHKVHYMKEAIPFFSKSNLVQQELAHQKMKANKYWTTQTHQNIDAPKNYSNIILPQYSNIENERNQDNNSIKDGVKLKTRKGPRGTHH